MSLLTIIQDAARRLNISAPATVVGNADLNAALLLSLAQQEGEELSRRHDWQNLITTRTFTSLAAVIQTACIPTDYDRFVYNVEIWNRTRVQKYIGPTPSRIWQQLVSTGITGGTPGRWRLLANELNIYPAAAAGETIAFEYVSKNFCDIGAGGTPKSAWTIDTDIARMPERLLSLGIEWRWQRAKGMDYSEEMATYEREVEKACSRDRGTGVIRISTDDSPLPTWPGTITP